MTRTGIGQTLVAGTVIWAMCSIPSCVLVPINTILKYLACVVIYPDVRLTWLGLAGCVPDLRVLLQTRVFVSITMLYLILWWLWPGHDRISMILKPPVWTLRKGYASWRHLVEYTRTCLNWVIYHQGMFSWSDAEYVSAVTQGMPSRHPVPIKLLRKLGWETGSWRVVSSKVYHLHVRVHTLIWRVTSYHIRLHMRIWLLAIEWMFCRFVSNHVLSTAGTHLDVIQQHKVKFLLLRQLPLRMLSRWWGQLNQIDLPLWLRVPMCRLYIRVFGVNLQEAERTDLTFYKNLSQFFRRSLKTNLRPTDKSHCLTSPADGRILHLGKVDNGLLEQVKGVTYSLSLFIGQDYKFMELFKSRRSSPAPMYKTSEPVVQCQKSTSKFAFSTDIHSGPASDNHMNGLPTRKCGTDPCAELLVPMEGTNLLKMDPIEREMIVDTFMGSGFSVTADGKSANCYAGRRIQIQSSTHAKNPIRLTNDKESPTDEIQVEEHIYERVYAIEEDQLLTEHGSVEDNDKVNYFNLPPDLMSVATPSTERDILLQREAMFGEHLLVNPGHVLQQCIVYLAPGDYHRFHSPVDWTVYHRRHFTGNLFSVNPNIAKWLQGLFTINERVLYVGRWKYGFFSMTPVGATNVGTINVLFDEKLQTNSNAQKKEQSLYSEASFRSHDQRGVTLKRGQLMGDFNLGSTIVLLFEAPPEFRLRNNPGDRVRYGQGMTKLSGNDRKQSGKRRRKAHRKK